MASTYRDSAGVERPTQWERANQADVDLDDVLTPETQVGMARAEPAACPRRASGMGGPLQHDATGRGWCAKLQRARTREQLELWRNLRRLRAELRLLADRWTVPG